MQIAGVLIIKKEARTPGEILLIEGEIVDEGVLKLDEHVK